MLKVECIKNTNSAVLEVGRVYYAFPLPNGTHAYISKFPRETAHTGCFSIDRFQVTDREVLPPTRLTGPPKVRQLKPVEQYYQLKLICVPIHYQVLLYGCVVSTDEFAVYTDAAFQKPIGTLKAKMFEKVKEVQAPHSRAYVSPFPAVLKYGDLIEMRKAGLCEEVRIDPFESEQLSLF